MLNKSKELFLRSDIKKFVMFNVSAAFHSKFMNSAQDQLALEIDKLTFLDNKIKIITNYDADIHKDLIQLK